MAFNNFMGKRKWRHHFEAGQEAFEAGDLVNAEESLRHALELSVGIKDKDCSYGDTALLLGQVYRRRERYQESDEMSRQAFSYYQASLGLTDPRTVQAHLAIVLSHPKESHSDLDVRKATFELAKAQFGEKSWQAIRTSALAMPTFNYHEREKVVAAAHAACSGILGQERAKLALWPPVAGEFAEALLEQGLGEQAAKFLGFQLRLHEEKLGPKSQEVALTRLRLGELFLTLGESKKAETAFGSALEIIRLKVGPKSDEMRRGQVALARALAQQKKLNEAAPYLTDALSFLASNQIEERTEVLLALLEQKCLVAGADSERGALWQELEAVWERADSDSVRERILAGLLAAQARLQQAWEMNAADRFLHAVLARVRQWRGATHHDVAVVLSELALCSIGIGDIPKAQSFIEQSVAIDEGVDLLTRAAYSYAKLGDSEKAQQFADRAILTARALPAGPDQGRRQAKLAEALLGAGNLARADEFAKLAERQVPDSEQPWIFCLLGRVQVCRGQYSLALRTYGENVPRLTDPYERAVGFIQLAWLQARTGDFESARHSLGEVDRLSEMRGDHPAVFMAKAVASQIAFYSGLVHEGRELRQAVLSYLKAGRHTQTTRALDILVLLEPFGQEEGSQELEAGTEILAATNFPERNISVFPVVDAACVGLRHVTRALFFSDQLELARERLSQYESRFLGFYRPDNALASSVHLTRATLATTDGERLVALEAALPGLRTLSPQHVSLFPTLLKLTEVCIRVGDVNRALSHCRAALEIRKAPRLLEWNEILERGELPEAVQETVERAPVASISPGLKGGESTSEAEVSLESPREQEPSRPQSTLQAATHSAGSPITDEDRPTIRDDSPTEENEGSVLIATGGAQNLSQLQAARILSERAEAPTPQEAQDFLNEVRARFGEELEPNLEARLLLALLFPDGSPDGTRLWAEALDLISEAAGTDLLTVENRARDANAWSLVVQTLWERLRRENDRFGENAVETLETQLRLAKALEAKGELAEAYHRLTMVTEILRSWFGARSRRLLDPLAELIRVAEKLDDVQAAFEHQLERHRLLEAAEGDAEELCRSRISLLPLRGRLGQVDELLAEAAECERELLGFRGGTVSEFVRVVVVAAQRVDQLHWRCDVASTLMEIALRVLPENEVSLGCRVKIQQAEYLFRKDYRSQAVRLRSEALDKATSLDADARAEMLHLAARSCLRIHEIETAREIAERILDERIAQAGRKDIWAGRALLIMAEADLRTYRLEGTETEISMSAPSLQGTRYWTKAQSLKLQALYFLNRFAEAYKILESLPVHKRLDLELKLAVWRGQGSEFMHRLTHSSEFEFRKRWERIETLPLNEGVGVLEFFAETGQMKLLAEGFSRLKPRLEGIVATDLRDARVKILSAYLDFWNGECEASTVTLLRTIELLPEGLIEFPHGLTSNLIREALVRCFLSEGRATSALAQAQQGVAESAELLGEEDVRAQAFRVRLAECARALGQTDDALVLLDEILEPLQELLGDTHPLLREVYRGLAKAFLDQDDAESAQMSAEEALRIDTECRGYSFHVLQDLELLAEITSRFDLEEAFSVFEQALRLAPDILPEGHPFTRLLLEKRDSLAEVLESAEPVPTAAPVQAAKEESPDEPSVELGPAENLFQGIEPPVEQGGLEQDEPLQAVDSADALFEHSQEEEFELNEDELAELRESGEFEVDEEALESARQEIALEDTEVGLEDWVALEEVQSDEAPVEQPKPEFDIGSASEHQGVDLEVLEGEFDDPGEEEPSDLDLQVVEGEFDDEDDFVDDYVGTTLTEAADVPTDEIVEEAADEADEADEPAEKIAGEPDEGQEASDTSEAEAQELVEEVETTEAVEEATEPVEEVVESLAVEETTEAVEEATEPVEEVVESLAVEETTEAVEEATEPVEEVVESLAVEETTEAVEEATEPVEEVVETPEDRTETAPAPYRLKFQIAESNPVVGGASVEVALDFPEVPLRLPEVYAEQRLEAGIVEAAEPSPQEPQFEQSEEDREEFVESATQAPDATELETEVSVDASIEISVDQMLEISDPEGFLLPLAPVFFLPVPWKEATEAPFERRYEPLYERFQEAFSSDGDWRAVVEEAVSTVRRDPCPPSGYFLFLLGAQLEKSGHLHVADVCLATAIELLESGAPLGAACHLAGRVAGRRGELRRALDYFDRAAELAEEPELAVLKIDAAECQLGLGRPEEALLGFEEVYDYLTENVPKVQALAVQAKMAQIHLLIGDPDSSLAMAEETLKNLSPKNVGTYRVLGRILLSRAFARLGRYELALELANIAWDGAKGWSAKRKDGRRMAISNLADILCVVGRFAEAEKLIQESGLTDWGLAEAELLLRAGHIACAQGRLEQARRYGRLGKSFLGRFQSPALWQSCFFELESDICLQEGDYSKAEAHCEAALSTFEREATGPVDRSRHLVRAAKIAGAQGAVSEALELVDQAHSLRDLHLGSDHPHTSSIEGLSAVLSVE